MKLFGAPVRPEHPALFNHQHDRESRQCAEKKSGRKRQQRAVEILADHQSFAEAKGMDPGFGHILDQDTDNLYAQQEGLEASAKGGLTLATYQEIRVRHFEQAIDKYMAMEPLQVEMEKLQRCSK